MLSPAAVTFYRDQGYLVVPDVLDAPTLHTIRAEMARILDAARAVATHTDRYDLEPGHRPDDPRVRRVKMPHRFYPVFQQLMRHPSLVAVLHDLLGPAVRLHGSKINLKSPRYGSPVEWHQDWAFYPHTNDDLLAVGVMLDDCTSDNGPLLVVPGSHRGPTFDHHTGDHHTGDHHTGDHHTGDHHADRYFCGAIDPAAVRDEIARAVPLTGRAGSMSFHHVRLVHGSAQNVSSLPRTLLLYEYGAADAWPIMGVADLAEFDSRLITGAPTIEPRVVAAPVRLPLPAARHQGSIYENQSDAGRRYFLTDEPAPTSRS
ncbi:MAG: phytanoyl-CoA dioxygenase family protein [Candidatus Rokuibacteriota bacterium]